MKSNFLKFIYFFYKVAIIVSLIILFLGILRINFSFNADYYCADMYSDILYSKYACQYHSIFPEGWVFGNQFYVIATPVIAALFFNFSENPFIAMGIASSVMALGVIISFLWMLKSVFKNIWIRLTALLAFLVLTLLVGDPIYDINGWQLLFTMCSYYSCYTITAFIGFGIYLNISEFRGKQFKFGIIILILECIFSFCTGMQSLRQTAIMTLPLLGVEFVMILRRKINKEKIFNIKTVIAICISISNILGLIVIKKLDIPTNNIIGSLQIKSLRHILSSIIPEFFNITSIFGDNISKIFSIIIGLLFISILCLILIKSKSIECKSITLFLIFGILIVYAISIVTALNSRPIYYFMVFPLCSILIAFIIENTKNYIKLIITIILILTSSICFINKVPLKKPSHYIDNDIQEATELLLNEDITTLYAPFGFGGKISLNTNLKIKTGFWFNSELFGKVDYICNPDIFNISPEKTAYVFNSEDMKNEALKIADSKSAKTNLLYCSPENNIWIYSSSISLID